MLNQPIFSCEEIRLVSHNCLAQILPIDELFLITYEIPSIPIAFFHDLTSLCFLINFPSQNYAKALALKLLMFTDSLCSEFSHHIFCSKVLNLSSFSSLLVNIQDIHSLFTPFPYDLELAWRHYFSEDYLIIIFSSSKIF